MRRAGGPPTLPMPPMPTSSAISRPSARTNWYCHDRPVERAACSRARPAPNAMDAAAGVVSAHDGGDLAGKGYLSLVARTRDRRWQRLDVRAGEHALAG